MLAFKLLVSIIRMVDTGDFNARKDTAAARNASLVSFPPILVDHRQTALLSPLFFLRIFTNRLMQFYWIKLRTDLSVRSIAWERGWFIDRRVYRLHRFREGEQVGSQRVGFETERNRFGSSVFNPLRFPSSRANKTRLNNCLEQAGWLISPFRAEIERVWRRRSSLIDRFSASLSI